MRLSSGAGREDTWGRIMNYEIRGNWGRIDTGIYSKGWIILFSAGVKTRRP